MIIYWLQLLKETIIIQAFQQDPLDGLPSRIRIARNLQDPALFTRNQFHVINAARNMIDLNRKWGLGNVDQAYFQDEEMRHGAGFNESQADAILEARYTPPRLIEAVKGMLHFEANNAIINQYLSSRDAQLPDGWEEAFYERESPDSCAVTLNCQGVAWLLKDLGFLT